LSLERRLPPYLQLDGNHEFAHSVVPEYLAEGLIVYDVGGGKRPMIGAAQKSRLKLTVTGLDIDAGELARAPVGAYDNVICQDICRFRGCHDADLVICQALLEHVKDAGQAMAGLASIVRPGGRILLFIPSGNSIFARLNRLLPQGFKRRLLHGIYPWTAESQGFPAYYDCCTPGEMKRLASVAGLVTEWEKPYYRSMYFSFLFPLHVAWRLVSWAARLWYGPQACESFILVLRLPGSCVTCYCSPSNGADGRPADSASAA
jgi:2-polyprenyl-6-hydroxyphenyl methylase/3-demethylubiquinone-9 3-methyltransferase